MIVNHNKVGIKQLRKVSNFAKDKGILRTSAYRLLNEGVLDYTIIDDVVYVVVNDKAKGYKPRNHNNNNLSKLSKYHDEKRINI